MDMSHCGGMAHNYDEVSLKFYAHQFREILKEDAAQELLIRKITGESQSKAKNLEESPVKIESQIWKALKALLIE